MMDRPVENGCREARVDVPEQENPLSKHGHLLMSGPLGICDNPYCTICPSYFTSAGASVSTPPSKNAFFSGAKIMHVKLVGWRKYRFPPVMNPHTKVVQWWNRFFVISCLFAIFVDPLFFFLFSVRQRGYVCITINVTAAIVVTILRSFTDFIYLLHMLLQFRLAYVVPASRTVGAGELVDDPKQIARHYLQRWFLFDLFSVLPAPQIITWILIHRLNLGKANANFAKNLLRATVLLQYIPRCIRFVPLAVGSFAFETGKANFVINLLIYLLAGHVIGCSWYLLGFQRVYTCLHQVLNETGYNPPSLDCGDGKHFSSHQQTNAVQFLSQASNTCLVKPSFSYGIYTNAVPVTLKTQIISKYIYSLSWGFLQLSTLAGSLAPSLFVWEILFTMGIIGLGLLLFALLIGNMQTYLLSLSRRFDAEVMDGFFTCVERMVSSEQEREDISKEMEVYRMGGGTFGLPWLLRIGRPKCQMLGGQAMVPEYPIFKSLPFKCSAKYVVPLGVSATGVYLTKYTAKSAIDWSPNASMTWSTSTTIFDCG